MSCCSFGSVDAVSSESVMSVIVTLLETTGTNAATTLADGTVVGQIKIIVHDTAGGTSEMTPADPMGYIDVDFASLGDSFTCIWSGTKWAALANTALAADDGIIEITATD